MISILIVMCQKTQFSSKIFKFNRSSFCPTFLFLAPIIVNNHFVSIISGFQDHHLSIRCKILPKTGDQTFFSSSILKNIDFSLAIIGLYGNFWSLNIDFRPRVHHHSTETLPLNARLTFLPSQMLKFQFLWPLSLRFKMESNQFSI